MHLVLQPLKVFSLPGGNRIYIFRGRGYVSIEFHLYVLVCSTFGKKDVIYMYMNSPIGKYGWVNMIMAWY